MKTTRLYSLSRYDAVRWKYECCTQEQLAAYRRQIDSLDQHIVELLQQRARVVEEVGNIKREAHLPATVISNSLLLSSNPLNEGRGIDVING